MRPGEVEDLAKKLKLFPDFTEIDYEMSYDLVEAKLKAYVERWHTKQRRAELSVQDIHRSLPTLDYDRTYVRGSCGIIHNSSAESQVPTVLALRSSHAASRGQGPQSSRV